MADRYNGTGQRQLTKQPKATVIRDAGASFRRPQESTKRMGVMALLISTGILVILDGITVTTTVIGLVFLVPMIIITSPIWVPIGILLFLVVMVVLSLSGLGLAVAVVLYLFPPIRKYVVDSRK